jgi:hypothetical protein
MHILDIPLHFRSKVREKKLREQWGFKCACRLCNAPPADLGASDDRRIKILGKRDKAVAAIEQGDAVTSIKLFKEVLVHLEEEGLYPLYQEPYDILSKIYWAMGDRKEAMKYATLKLDNLDVYGPYHPTNRTADLQDLVKELIRFTSWIMDD